MGLAVLFRLDDDCIGRHKGERKVRGADDEDGAVDADEGSHAKREKGEKASSSKEDVDEEEAEDEEDDERAKASREEGDEDFDVTSAMVKGLSLANKKVVLSELSSEEDSEVERREVDRKEESKEPKKRMSVAEKRRMKKAQEKGTATVSDRATGQDRSAETQPTADGVQSSASAEDGDGIEEDSKSVAGRKKSRGKARKKGPAAADKDGGTGAKAAPSAAPLSRGKRNKLKRLAGKYADQDEEDLLIAASVLGLQNVQKKKAEIQQRERQMRPHPSADADDHADDEEADDADSNKASEATRPAPHKKSGGEEEDVDRVCFRCKQRGHLYKNCPLLKAQAEGASSSTETTAVGAPQTFSAARRAAQTEEELELQRLQEEENIDASAVDSSPLGLVDTLTATPFEDDRLQFAVAVCAPYSALSTYRFKAKLMAGSMKKGKLCEAALNVWMRQPGVREAEKEALRLMRQEEMMAVLLSGTKLAAGLAGEAGKKRRQNEKRQGSGED